MLKPDHVENKQWTLPSVQYHGLTIEKFSFAGAGQWGEGTGLTNAGVGGPWERLAKSSWASGGGVARCSCLVTGAKGIHSAPSCSLTSLRPVYGAAHRGGLGARHKTLIRHQFRWRATSPALGAEGRPDSHQGKQEEDITGSQGELLNTCQKGGISLSMLTLTEYV